MTAGGDFLSLEADFAGWFSAFLA